jgi:hypothetical protein
MGPLHRLWPALEDIPGGEAVIAEWRFRLGPDFDSAQSLLRMTDQEVGSYPAIAGQCLPYRVVKHGADDFAGVPPDGGETISLRLQDVLVNRLDHRKLSKEISTAFGFSSEFDKLPGVPVTWMIGSGARGDGNELPVHLVIPAEPGELHRAIEAIAALCGESGIVIAPTRRCFRPMSERLLRLTKGHFIALGQALQTRERDKWLVNSDAANMLTAFLAPGGIASDDPLNERSQLVLIAMHEMGLIDSDHRRSNDEITAKAIGPSADANALKAVMADLVTRELVLSKTGRGGGYWLTEKGCTRAEKLRSQ